MNWVGHTGESNEGALQRLLFPSVLEYKEGAWMYLRKGDGADKGILKSRSGSLDLTV